MQIPKKINPDNLKDTIIQIVFNPSIPPEVVIGSCYQTLLDSHEFIVGPVKKEVKLTEKDGVVLESIERGYFLHRSKKVKLNVTPNSIVFNSYEKYAGWAEYYPLIEETLSKLFNASLIESVTRVGVRYISQFDANQLVDMLNMQLRIDNIRNKSLDSTQIRSEYIDDKFKIILTFLNRISAKPDKATQGYSSVVDIDIIQFQQLMNLDDVLLAVKAGHEKEKETFFSLLKPDFLKSLNPEY